MSPLESIRARLSAELTKRAEAQTGLDSILDAPAAEGRNLNETENVAFTAARSALASHDEAIAEMRAAESDIVDAEARKAAAAAIAGQYEDATGSSVVVTRNEQTYRKGGDQSYFRDLARANAPGGGDSRSKDRLTRHAQEMDVELRTNMSRTDGQGGEFVPPLWLLDEYIALARAGRVTADLVRKQALPAGTDSINLPKVSTGTATAEQADLGSVSNTAMTTTSVSGAVTTVAGQQVFAMQLLDQSPINFDEVVFADLLADLAVRVDSYVLSKASIGILNVSSPVAVTFTSASPTPALLYPKVSDAIQQIETQRYLPPQAIVMHPRRWAWFLSSLDSSNRPLVVPTAQGPYNAFAGFGDVRAEGVVGTLQGLPVYVDPNVPTNTGAGTNQDTIIVARFDDLYLYESDVRTRVLFETDADTLSVRLQVWEYAAFIGNRLPKAIGLVTGTGLVTPTF